jgi:hypothetical protein
MAEKTITTDPPYRGKEIQKEGTALATPGQPRPLDSYRYDHLITEDDTPVDNWIAEAMYRLMVEPLYTSWEGPVGHGGKFIAAANVGVFADDSTPLPPVCPDILLSLGVELPDDIRRKDNRSYFIWKFGKPPDAVTEIVSDTPGGEDTTKLKLYAKLGVPYYIIFDPFLRLKKGLVRVFKLEGRKYQLLPAWDWLPELNLGLKLWEGEYDGRKGVWLRWCDRHGTLLPTGAELAQRADTERQRADTERQRADTERQRADTERQRAERLAAKLRAAGLDPDVE